jgi:hypothetical protein
MSYEICQEKFHACGSGAQRLENTDQVVAENDRFRDGWKEGERKPRQNALAADQRWLIEFVSDAKLVCQFEVTPFSVSLPISAFNLR